MVEDTNEDADAVDVHVDSDSAILDNDKEEVDELDEDDEVEEVVVAPRKRGRPSKTDKGYVKCACTHHIHLADCLYRRTPKGKASAKATAAIKVVSTVKTAAAGKSSGKARKQYKRYALSDTSSCVSTNSS